MIHGCCDGRLMGVVFTVTALCAGGLQDVPQHGGTDASAQPAVDVRIPTPLPEQPHVLLTPISGYPDEVAYQQAIADRVSKLVGLADESQDDLSRVQLLLAAANLILGDQLEPECTKKLLQIPDEPGAPCADEIRGALDRADTLLGSAQGILERAGGGQDAAGISSGGWTRRLEALQAFGMALRAYLLPDDAADATREARHAASRLSPLLEDNDIAIAKAAALWQAALRSREADSAPALSVLDLALSDPPARSQPYSFFSRLLRCRLIAARGGHAAAIGLLLQIEERSREWFNDVAQRDAAMRTAQLVRLQIMRSWHDELASTDHAAERQWCADHIEILVTEHFGEADTAVIRLAPSIPTVKPAPNHGAGLDYLWHGEKQRLSGRTERSGLMAFNDLKCRPRPATQVAACVPAGRRARPRTALRPRRSSAGETPAATHQRERCSQDR